MTQKSSSENHEIEIKVQVKDLAAFAERLPAMGFSLKTPETLERNVLFDTPERTLREQKQLLRIREYGPRWVLTHKAQKDGHANAVHKIRVETETDVQNGEALAKILQQLGYGPVFTYEKYRTEWADAEGHVVLDRTPIGNFAELEGEPEWIDATAAKLQIHRNDYMTASYGQLFLDWKQRTGHNAVNMTFSEISR